MSTTVIESTIPVIPPFRGHVGTTYRASRTGADVGPVVEVTRYLPGAREVVERWVCNEVMIVARKDPADPPMFLAWGIRLRPDGTMDRRQVSPRGGVSIRPIPGIAGRRWHFTGAYSRPESPWGKNN